MSHSLGFRLKSADLVSSFFQVLSMSNLGLTFVELQNVSLFSDVTDFREKLCASAFGVIEISAELTDQVSITTVIRFGQ